jgi:hypothetical protein
MRSSRIEQRPELVVLAPVGNRASKVKGRSERWLAASENYPALGAFPLTCSSWEGIILDFGCDEGV